MSQYSSTEMLTVLSAWYSLSMNDIYRSFAVLLTSHIQNALNMIWTKHITGFVLDPFSMLHIGVCVSMIVYGCDIFTVSLVLFSSSFYLSPFFPSHCLILSLFFIFLSSFILAFFAFSAKHLLGNWWYLLSSFSPFLLLLVYSVSARFLLAIELLYVSVRLYYTVSGGIRVWDEWNKRMEKKLPVALNNIFRWQYYRSGYVTLIFNRNHFFSRSAHFTPCILYNVYDVVPLNKRLALACTKPFKYIKFHAYECSFSTYINIHKHTSIYFVSIHTHLSTYLHAKASFVLNRYHPIISFNMIHFQISFVSLSLWNLVCFFPRRICLAFPCRSFYKIFFSIHFIIIPLLLLLLFWVLHSICTMLNV